ncbi:MAG: DUF6020 family protein, partial [Eubacterium sp.]|nr:DUF6020 family protein [Eubacterium sp.]
AGALIFAYMLELFKKYKMPLLYRSISLAFFALFPIFPMYAVTATKDMLFGLVFIWMAMELWQAIKEGAWSVKRGILFVVSGLIFCLLRNNGFYILLVFALATPIFFRKKLKLKTFVLCLVPLFVYQIMILKILFPALEIENGSKREMLSVPFQQVARYAYVWGDKGLSQEDVDHLDRILQFDGDMKVLAENYNSTWADPIKARFNKEASSQDLKVFMNTWLKMVKKHPITAIEAFLKNNFLLTSSKGCGKIVYVNQIESASQSYNWYGITETKGGSGVRQTLSKVLEYMSNIPILGLFFSALTYNFLLAFFMVYFLVKRQYDKFLLVTLFALCIGTMLLGPIIYMRYMIPGIMAVPLYGGIAMVRNENKKEEENG